MESLFKYLEAKKIEVIPAQTLFEPDWKMLNQDRCPLCGNKLKNGRVWICRSKKHGKPYIITHKRMNELQENQEKKRKYLESNESGNYYCKPKV